LEMEKRRKKNTTWVNKKRKLNDEGTKKKEGKSPFFFNLVMKGCLVQNRRRT